MFFSTAIIEYDQKFDILRANLLETDDLIDYYKNLYYKYSWNVNYMWSPRHDGHITIYRPEFHGFVTNNPRRYEGDIVSFKYNPEEIYDGGHYKQFLGFYLPVYSEDIEQIKENLGVVDKKWDSLHISLFNNKLGKFGQK